MGVDIVPVLTILQAWMWSFGVSLTKFVSWPPWSTKRVNHPLAMDFWVLFAKRRHHLVQPHLLEWAEAHNPWQKSCHWGLRPPILPAQVISLSQLHDQCNLVSQGLAKGPPLCHMTSLQTTSVTLTQLTRKLLKDKHTNNLKAQSIGKMTMHETCASLRWNKLGDMYLRHQSIGKMLSWWDQLPCE